MTNYNVIVYYDDATITCVTSSIHVVWAFLRGHYDRPIEVIDGSTCEILCMLNCEKPILQEDFGLSLLNFLMEQARGTVPKMTSEEG